ncbi:MAG: iron-containing alcohol dehydrogenase [Lachnospiraceae bacterium]|nr:iron-containing alcohol dehydrogenase [Lachnospiraceae bacterium]
MSYITPVKVYSEENAVINHADELCSYGSKALLVTGRSSAVRCGAQEDVTIALDKCGLGYAVYNEIEENPSVETVMKARDFGLSNACDFVIGIGGGSPLDAAKSIAIMMFHKDKQGDFLHVKGYEGASDMRAESLPVIAIPTTCGTGSEVTAVSVLTRNDLSTKVSSSLKLFPAMALLDYRYLKAAPKELIINTSVDALGHLIESYIHTATNPVSAETVREGLVEWSKTKDVLTGLREPSDEDYKSLLYSSNLAGQAIAQTGTSLPHALSYRLTFTLGIPHGRAIGFFLPGYVRFADDEMKNNVLSWAGFGNFDEFDRFIRKTTVPENVPADDWNRLTELSAEEILKAPDRIARVPYPFDRSVLDEIRKK